MGVAHVSTNLNGPLMSLPVGALTFFGALVTLLGIFAAGNIGVVALGIGALVAAGIVDVATRRSGSASGEGIASPAVPARPDDAERSRRRVRSPSSAVLAIVVLVAAAIALALVGVVSGARATGGGPPDPTPTEASGLPDGAHVGRIVGMSASSPASLTVDLVELLTGPEAVEAAKEDGFLGPDETDLPNDVYVRDPDSETYVAWVSGSATVALFDCARGCEQVEVGLDDFLAGGVRAFNREYAVYDLTVSGGEVVEIAEIYLP